MIVLSVFAFIDRITLIAHCNHITQSSSPITAQPSGIVIGASTQALSGPGKGRLFEGRGGGPRPGVGGVGVAPET